MPSPAVGRLALPLGTNHFLVIVGGFLIVVGFTRGATSLMLWGLAVLVIGIGLEIAVIRWAHRQLLAGVPEAARATSPRSAGASLPSIRRSLCVACGWSGPSAGTSCPRCGRVTIRSTL